MCLLWYNKLAMNNTNIYYNSKQGRFPVFISDCLEISDSVNTSDHIMDEIEIARYLKSTTATVGRKGNNPVNMLKTILFGFMDKGYLLSYPFLKLLSICSSSCLIPFSSAGAMCGIALVRPPFRRQWPNSSRCDNSDSGSWNVPPVQACGGFLALFLTVQLFA